MYFPYLRDRQAEKLVLRGLAAALGKSAGPQLIWPLIEPVTPATKGLTRALDELASAGRAAYVIVNPHQGVLASAVEQTSWASDMSSYLADARLVRPTLLEQNGTTIAHVAAFVAAYSGRDIGIVLTSTRLDPSLLAATLASNSFLAFLTHTVSRPAYESALGVDRTVNVENNFPVEARNRDYSGDQTLGSAHLNWAGLKKAGFSDYTVLPAKFSDGGGPVGAVAIHMTYETSADLRVQHFVSVTNAQTDPIADKWFDVLTDLASQISATPPRFHTSNGLAAFTTQGITGNYTNLSGSKKQQVDHHIFTIGKHLGL